MTSYRTLLLALALGLALAPAGRADKGDDKDFLKNGPKVLAAFRDVVAGPSQSTVRVRCDGKDAALGTVVAADGWVLTKASELKGKVACKFKDGRELDARVVGISEPYDLALLKVDAKGLTPVEWRDSKQAAVGSWVASPAPGDEPVAVGVVSVAARKVKNPGPIVAPSADSGYLGVVLGPGDGGATVREVLPGTPAAKLGLKVNDVIFSIAGETIIDPDSVMKTLQGYKPNDEVTIQFRRGDEEVEKKAKLAPRPPNGLGDFQNHLGNAMSRRYTGFPEFLQHDTVLKPGDCGGPLVDLDGKAVGINIARAGRTETYAIPAEAVPGLLTELKSGKLAPEVLNARSAALKAEVLRAAADKKLTQAKETLARAKADTDTSEEKLEELTKAVEKAQAALADAQKRLDKAKADLAKAEADAQKK